MSCIFILRLFWGSTASMLVNWKSALISCWPANINCELRKWCLTPIIHHFISCNTESYLSIKHVHEQYVKKIIQEVSISSLVASWIVWFHIIKSISHVTSGIGFCLFCIHVSVMIHIGSKSGFWTVEIVI